VNGYRWLAIRAQGIRAGGENASIYWRSMFVCWLVMDDSHLECITPGDGHAATNPQEKWAFRPPAITCDWVTRGHLAAPILNRSTAQYGSSEHLATSGALGRGSDVRAAGRSVR